MEYNKSALALALLAIAPQAFAGGYQILEKNAQGLGRAYAGDAAIARDATTIGTNPAGMSRLRRPTFSVSAATLDTSLNVEVEDAGVNIPSLEAAGLNPKFSSTGKNVSSDVGPSFPLIPAVYAAYPLNESYTVGLGVFSNFSSKTKYESDFISSLLAETSEVVSTNVNPSVSFALNPRVSFGFGVDAVYIQAKLSSANPNQAPLVINGANVPNPVTGEVLVLPNGSTIGSSSIEGDDWGYGWNFGVLGEPIDGTRIGFAYRSPIQTTLEGDARFKGTPDVDSFVDFAGKAPLELPALVSLSLVQDLGNQLSLSADVTQTRWSNFKDLTIYRKDNGAASSTVDERWNDSIRIALGLDYQYLPALGFRVGYAYDNSPIPDERRTLRIPTGDYRWYTAGASYTVNEMISLDLGLAHVVMARTPINDERTFVGRPFTAYAKGNANAEGNVFATQLNVTL